MKENKAWLAMLAIKMSICGSRKQSFREAAIFFDFEIALFLYSSKLLLFCLLLGYSGLWCSIISQSIPSIYVYYHAKTSIYSMSKAMSDSFHSKEKKDPILDLFDI